jgi:hypothetical protein
MTDLHLRILRMVARQRQRELDEHLAADRAGGHASAGDRRDLEHAAGQATANVSAAVVRRRLLRPRPAPVSAGARSH